LTFGLSGSFFFASIVLKISSNLSEIAFSDSSINSGEILIRTVQNVNAKENMRCVNTDFWKICKITWII